jgi:hypothetical protein
MVRPQQPILCRPESWVTCGILLRPICRVFTRRLHQGAEFPPLVVFHDGTDYWLADGFHRLGAYDIVAKALELPSIEIECDVREGTLRDAILYACGANDSHGIQRTNDDKRNAVDTVLKNPLVSINPDTGEPWGDREIARICKVSHQLVMGRRAKLTGRATSQRRTYRHNKSGKPTVMNTGGINKDRAEAETQAEAPAADQPAADQPAQETPAETGKVIQYISRWSFIYTRLREIDEAVAKLPAPAVAAENYPVELAHTLPLARVLELKRWLVDFARFWEARDPEIQRFRREQQLRIQEAMNERTR